MKTILAAIDFSPVTSRVLAEAVALARDSQARLILLNVTTPATLVQDYAALEAAIAGTEPERENSGGALRAKAIHGESLQVIGEPVDVILEQAARCSADYIVMGSHGRTALFNLLVGGTAAGVLRGAKCPVILIPPMKRKRGMAVARPLRRKDPVAWLHRVERRKAQPMRSRSKLQLRPSTGSERRGWTEYGMEVHRRGGKG